MIKNYLFAKSNREDIKSHTNKLLNLYEQFEKLYGTKLSQNQKDGIVLCCQYHDIGKCNSRFQNKLCKIMGLQNIIGEELDSLYVQANVKEIPHGYFSAAFLDYYRLKEKFGDVEAKAIITAICNHHSRYLETIAHGKIDDKYVRDIISEEMNCYSKLYDNNLIVNTKALSRNQIVLNNSSFPKPITDEQWELFAYFKGMLNKFDFGASCDTNEVEIEGENATENIISNFQIRKFELNECQRFMLENQDVNIIVIASTGIGKTEAAMLWQENCKTFYTLPIKVAINSIYNRIVYEKYYAEEKVAFLHSDTLSMMLEYEENNNEDEKEEVYEQYNKIKNLSYPMTVCTIDQLFIFVFKALGTEIMPSTLSYSKLIIDEIQSYSPKILAMIIYGLKVITDMGGKFCIMTATLPPCICDFLKLEGVEFKMPEKPYLKISDNTKKPIVRHKIQLIEDDFDYIEIANLSEKHKILIIVNTVAQSQKVYIELKSLNENVWLLHSRFKQEEREKKQNEILMFAKSKNNGIWISTQIVEASLDIDFDVLYTEMCTADSLLQRMGRCYRNRDYKIEKCNIKIYNTKNGRSYIYDKDIYDRSWFFLKQYQGVFDEQQKTEYVNKVYCSEDIRNTQYYKDISNTISYLKNLCPAYINKSDALQRFRDIQNYSLLTRVDYDTFINDGTVGKLNKPISIKEKIDLLNKIRKKTINMSHINPAKFNITKSNLKGFWVVDNKYDDNIGLLDELESNNFW